MPRKKVVEQIRGASSLVTVATKNVTTIVEQMHRTIGGGPKILGSPLARVTTAVTAPVYAAVRGVTSLVGGTIDFALDQLGDVLDHPGPERSALLAALNGVVGDHLASTGNPLAIEMCLCRDGVGLELTPAALAERFPAGDQLVVLVHGSCMDDAQWLMKGHDHGAALARDLGVVPLYVRYNSGQHVSENGDALHALLEVLVTSWPRPVRGLHLLAHSMGGLVSRSAIAAADTREGGPPAWRGALRSVITLGTPHHGAPLEQGGNMVDLLLTVSRYSAPLAALGKLRSAGVTDLRFGNIVAEHWQGKDRFEPGSDGRRPVPLPEGVPFYAVAGTVTGSPLQGMVGDGLVPVASALGRHARAEHVLSFADTATFAAHSHLDLLGSPEVYAAVKGWLSLLVESSAEGTVRS